MQQVLLNSVVKQMWFLNFFSENEMAVIFLCEW